MFAKFKSGNQPPQNPIDANPITQYFEIGKVVACAGPELVWKIHDAYRKGDRKVSLTNNQVIGCLLSLYGNLICKILKVEVEMAFKT
jgi:hypothetical protein